jgi:hypothetical protein
MLDIALSDEGEKIGMTRQLADITMQLVPQ